MRLDENEKKMDFQLLKEELAGIGIASEAYQKGDVMEEQGLLIILDDESNYADRIREKTGEEVQISIVSYMFEMDDEEDQLYKYILMFSELNGTYDDYNELELYRFLNAFNQRISIGYFYPEKDENGSTKIRFKNTMHGKLGEPIDTIGYCELIIQTIFYMGILTDELNRDFLEE